MSIAKGSVFCLPQHQESYAADVFGGLAAADRLRGLARDPFITALAGYFADVNALHPFPEGNGRAQRAFFFQLAHDAGHHIAWVRMDPDRNMAASAAAHHDDLAPLRELLDKLTDLPHPSGPPSPQADPQPDLPPHGRCRPPATGSAQPGSGLGATTPDLPPSHDQDRQQNNSEHVTEYLGLSGAVMLPLLHDFPDPGKSHRFPGSSPPSDTLNPHERPFHGHARIVTRAQPPAAAGASSFFL